MENIDCQKLDSCEKINCIMDKDMPDFLVARSIYACCGICKVKQPKVSIRLERIIRAYESTF